MARRRWLAALLALCPAAQARGASDAAPAPAPEPALAPAPAPAPAPLGGAQQVLIAGTAAGSAGVDHSAPNGQGNTTWSLQLGPRAGLFVTERVFVSLDARFGASSAPQVSAVALGLGPAAGVHLRIAERIGFLPAAGLAYTYAGVQVGASDVTTHALSLRLLAPFVYTLAPRVGISFGPTLEQDLVRSVGGTDAARATQVSLEAGMLIWL